MYTIAIYLAKAGASEKTIITALANRDIALGFRKYADQPDDTEYQRAAAKALKEVARETIRADVSLSTGDQGFRFTELSALLAEAPEEVDYVWDKTLPTGGISIQAAKPKVG